MTNIFPSEHLITLHPLGMWISRSGQMNQITSSIESLVIQKDIGNNETSLKLTNLPSLLSLEIGSNAFNNCQSIVFESMNEVNDEE